MDVGPAVYAGGMDDTAPLRILITPGLSISALLLRPDEPRACLVLAHGAGAGMHHAFLADLAKALGGRGIATLRYQFPYMEQGSKRPDSPAVAHQAVRAAVAQARHRFPGIALFAGGKSFGGRMTSQAQAEDPLPGVKGIVFVGFPLHPAGQPSTQRAEHLDRVAVPMLFLQGTRDTLADLALVRDVVGRIGSRATLHVEEGADHSFHVLARSGRRDADVMEALADAAAAWMTASVR